MGKSKNIIKKNLIKKNSKSVWERNINGISSFFYYRSFSTQMGTDVGTERSRQSDLVEVYPSLLSNQYYLPMNI